jgi:hypothetical protein
MSQSEDNGKIGETLCLEGIIPRRLYEVIAEILSFTYAVNKEWSDISKSEGGENTGKGE